MSMTIQQAIENRERCLEYLENCAVGTDKECVEAVMLSLQALREKAERDVTDINVGNKFDKDTNVFTHADRIRAMSDEELAEFLCGVYDEDEDAAKIINGVYIPCYDQYSIKEWLKQPAEEG